MAGRVLNVTSHTTLDYVDASARGPGWRDEGIGILDVHTPAGDPDAVTLEFELDPTATDHVEPHADKITLTTDQAQELSDALAAAIQEDSSDRPRRLER